jgi:hypothetical protein
MSWKVLFEVTGRRLLAHTNMCANHLPGLKYRHVCEYLHPNWQQEVVKGIKLMMGRDVEVTFDTTE